MRRRGFQWKRTKEGGMYLGLELTVDSQAHWSNR
jgi:hypothetical protein